MFNNRDEHPTQEFIGLVLDYNEDTQEVTLQQRNHFRKGEVVEFFGPKIETQIMTIDELFDELIDRQGKGNYMMWKLNSRGASFWKERNKYRTQIKDIREWSDLVLGPNDMMDIYGF